VCLQYVSALAVPSIVLRLGKKCCIFRWVGPGILKSCSTFIFKGKAVLEEIFLLSHWTWQQYISSKCRKPLTRWHNTTNQRTWILRNIVLKTASLAFNLCSLLPELFPFIRLLYLFFLIFFPLSLNLELVSIPQLFLHLVHPGFISTWYFIFSLLFLAIFHAMLLNVTQIRVEICYNVVKRTGYFVSL
jgi:hypothetical protein